MMDLFRFPGLQDMFKGWPVNGEPARLTNLLEIMGIVDRLIERSGQPDEEFSVMDMSFSSSKMLLPEPHFTSELSGGAELRLLQPTNQTARTFPYKNMLRYEWKNALNISCDIGITNCEEPLGLVAWYGDFPIEPDGIISQRSGGRHSRLSDEEAGQIIADLNGCLTIA